MASYQTTEITELRERIDTQLSVIAGLAERMPRMVESFVVTLCSARNGEQSLTRSAGNR